MMGFLIVFIGAGIGGAFRHGVNLLAARWVGTSFPYIEFYPKPGKARAVRFSTLEALCRELDCQPGDLLEWVREESEHQPPM